MTESRRRLFLGGRVVTDAFDGFEHDHAILARDGMIEAIGHIETMDAAGSEEISLDGGYVLPGFCDAHVHIAGSEVRNELELYVQHGVTQVRDLGSPAELTRETVESIARDERIGPRINSYGELVDGPAPRWPEITVVPDSKAKIATHVHRCRKLGLAGVKFYHKLSAELLESGLQASRSVGLLSAGHLGHVVSVGQALGMGIDSIEHICTLTRDLVPEGAVHEKDGYWHYFGPFLAWQEHVDLRSEAVEALIERFLRTDTTFVPTLTVYHRLVYGDTPEVADAPDLALLDPKIVDSWREAQRGIGLDEQAHDVARIAFEKMMRFIRLYHEAGGRLGVGTDAPNPFVVPGASLHDEIRLLVETGIPVDEVLRLACVPFREASGSSENGRGLVPGAEASFVVLGHDPLADVAATRTIRKVVVRGEIVTCDGELPGGPALACDGFGG